MAKSFLLRYALGHSSHLYGFIFWSFILMFVIFVFPQMVCFVKDFNTFNAIKPFFSTPLPPSTFAFITCKSNVRIIIFNFYKFISSIRNIKKGTLGAFNVHLSQELVGISSFVTCSFILLVILAQDTRTFLAAMFCHMVL